LRILGYFDYYVQSGHQGGAEVTAHATLHALKKYGHEVDVLMARPFPSGEESYVVDGINVQRFGSKRDPDYWFDRYDLIVTQLGTAQRAWYLSLKGGTPTLQLSHNFNAYSLSIAQYCQKLVVNSEHAQAEMEEFGVTRPMNVLYPLVDPAAYRTETNHRYISMVNMSDGTKPWYDKGPEMFYRLAQMYPGEEFLAVEGAHGIQDLRELPNVTIWPQQSNIKRAYEQSKVVLMPSRDVESFGRISVEAAASGIPSLVSDLPGPREAGTAYEYVPQDDADTWADALLEVLFHYERASADALAKSAALWARTQDQFQALLKSIGE